MEEKVWESWNGKIKHKYDIIFTPKDEEAIVKIVKNNEKVRVFGNKQSTADICAGPAALIDIKLFNKIINIDKENREITVESGITLKELLTKIEELNWSLPALPDIDTITLGGAISTGTHGTAKNGHLLSEYMVRCRLIKANGKILELDKSSDIFDAVRLSLGVLGILSSITLKCEEKFELFVEEEPMRDIEWFGKTREMLELNDVLRVLWLPHTNKGYVIRANKKYNGDFDKKDAPKYHKYRRAFSAKFYKITPYFPHITILFNRIIQKLFFNSKQKKIGTLYGTMVTKSRGNPLVLGEWTIPLSKFSDLFLELRDELNSIFNLSFAHIPMDIRFIKADNTWLSNAYKKDTVTIGCISRNVDKAETYKAFDTMQKVFLKYEGKPHWAKIHTLNKNQLRKLYPKLNDFIELRREMDPTNKFLNIYLEEIFG